MTGNAYGEDCGRPRCELERGTDPCDDELIYSHLPPMSITCTAGPASGKTVDVSLSCSSRQPQQWHLTESLSRASCQSAESKSSQPCFTLQNMGTNYHIAPHGDAELWLAVSSSLAQGIGSVAVQEGDVFRIGNARISVEVVNEAIKEEYVIGNTRQLHQPLGYSWEQRRVTFKEMVVEHSLGKLANIAAHRVCSYAPLTGERARSQKLSSVRTAASSCGDQCEAEREAAELRMLVHHHSKMKPRLPDALSASDVEVPIEDDAEAHRFARRARPSRRRRMSDAPALVINPSVSARLTEEEVRRNMPAAKDLDGGEKCDSDEFESYMLLLRDGHRLGIDRTGDLVALPPVEEIPEHPAAAINITAVPVAVVRFHGRRFWLHELPAMRQESVLRGHTIGAGARAIFRRVPSVDCRSVAFGGHMDGTPICVGSTFTFGQSTFSLTRPLPEDRYPEHWIRLSVGISHGLSIGRSSELISEHRALRALV